MSAAKKQKTDSNASVGAAAATEPVDSKTAAGSGGSGGGGGGAATATAISATATDLLAQWQTIAHTSTREISAADYAADRKLAVARYAEIDDSDAQIELARNRFHHSDVWCSEFKRIVTNDGAGGRPDAAKIHGMRV